MGDGETEEKTDLEKQTENRKSKKRKPPKLTPIFNGENSCKTRRLDMSNSKRKKRRKRQLKKPVTCL